MAGRDSFLLRLPPEVMDALRRWADDEIRSTNAQIEMILTQALKDAKRYPKKITPPKDGDPNHKAKG